MTNVEKYKGRRDSAVSRRFTAIRESEPSLSPSVVMQMIARERHIGWATVYRIIRRAGLITPQLRKPKGEVVA